MRKPARVISFLLLAAAVGAAWSFRTPLGESWKVVFSQLKPALAPKPKPDPRTYTTLTTDLEKWRKDLSARHRGARTAAERAVVENDARILLEHTLPAMMHCWLGTPWDFNGTAKGPGQGKIACGYFVATVLKDAGFQLDRYQLARQPSGNILQSFLPRDSCVLTVGKEYSAFASDMQTRDPGVYVVGLDTHVAFLVVTTEGFRFIHSSGSSPWCVVDESREQAAVLQRSNWRMFGNLTADTAVLRRWLRAEKIAVKGA